MEECKTAFYHVRFPSEATQAVPSVAPGVLEHDLGDRVYSKSNSSDFGVTEGRLHLRKPGTYLIHYDMRLLGLEGEWMGSTVEATVKVDTPEGHTPRDSRLVMMMREAVSKDARYHATTMVHIGDSAFGVDSYGATLTFLTEAAGGSFTYSSEVHATLLKL